MYSARAEAVGYTTVYNDRGFLFPYADPHAPHTIGTIASSLPATGFAAVVDPGTAANGLSAISQAAGGPVLPPNPTVVETRAGHQNDGSFGEGGPFEVISHSDTLPSTRQTAVTASDTGSTAAPALATGAGSATTSAALAGGAVTSVADVVLQNVSVPGAGFAARSVHSHVQVEWGTGGEPTVSRQIEVLGASVNGQPMEVIPEGQLPPPPSAGPVIATVRGHAGPQPDGSYEAHSDGLAVSFPVQGTLQTVTVLVGSTQVAMSVGLPVHSASVGVTASAPAPAPVTVAMAPPDGTAPPAVPPPSATAHRGAARRSPTSRARLVGITEETFPLVWLYLCWLCLGAALIAAACRVVLGRGARRPLPEIFD
jgi:hypothetical protein